MMNQLRSRFLSKATAGIPDLVRFANSSSHIALALLVRLQMPLRLGDAENPKAVDCGGAIRAIAASLHSADYL